MVFRYLVDKGLFRIGADLVCPSCRLTNWYALDQLRQHNTCDLCGVEFNATRQLVDGEFTYRRSGVLGLERNVQGAIPVLMVMQQMTINVDSIWRDVCFLPSIELTAKNDAAMPKCEIDFLSLHSGNDPFKGQIVLGECKDEGGVIDANDIDNMRRIAAALPTCRFEIYILFAKLSAFTPDEIALAKTLNGPYENRVILFTERELETYHLYERTAEELGQEILAVSLDDCAQVTRSIYFQDEPQAPNNPS